MKLLLEIVLVFGSFISFSQKESNEIPIVGNWKAKGCSTCQLSFNKNGFCYEYYEGKLEATYKFKLVKEGSICDTEVDEGPLFDSRR
ncbi:hypothetical protein [Ekhidna sp.]